MKFCQDCKSCAIAETQTGSKHDAVMLCLDSIDSEIGGEYIIFSCEVVRSEGGHCGIDGDHHSPKGD